MFILASLLFLADVWLPVYSHERSSAQLHVQSCKWDAAKNCVDDSDVKTWTFPADYTGHRSICHLVGATNATGFVAWVGGDTYSVGDPFGFTPAQTGFGVQAIDLQRVCAASSRINLWAEASDRKAWFGVDAPLPDLFYISSLGDKTTHVNVVTLPTTDRIRVRVMRLRIDGYEVADLNKPCQVVLDKMFSAVARQFLHEGDLIGGDKPDLDWSRLSTDFFSKPSYTPLTNMEYAVVFGDDELRSSSKLYQPITAHPLVISRRYEVERRVPTAIGMTGGASAATFRWRIDGEDPWASKFGSTYVAFRVFAYVDAKAAGRVYTYENDKYWDGVRAAEARAAIDQVKIADGVYSEAAATNAFSKCETVAYWPQYRIGYIEEMSLYDGVTNADFAAAHSMLSSMSNSINNARWLLGQIRNGANRYADFIAQCRLAVERSVAAHSLAYSALMPFDSGLQRMPPVQSDGGYRFTAAIPAADRANWAAWQVFTFNSKFKNIGPGSVVVPVK